MRRGWWLVLLLSTGLNVGLVWATIGGDPSRLRAGGGAGAGEHGRPAPAPAPGDSELCGERHCRVLAARLGLTPTGADSLEEVHLRRLPQIHLLRREVGHSRRALAAACREPDLPEDLVMERLAGLTAAQARLDSLVMAAVLEELRLLDPDQREAYLRLMAWERRFGERPGPPPGRGRGGRGPRVRGGTGSSAPGHPAP